jgi:methylmalonyl-CoA/ethylmalonyl-CoA epimerase
MIEVPHPAILPAGFEFHHVGYATNSVENEEASFRFLGYKTEGPVFTDQVQGVSGVFMTGPGPRVEILENLPGRLTLSPWLRSGSRFYHFAYWVDSLLHAVEWSRGNRAKLLAVPEPAPAFGGRRIAFVIFRGGLMLEFIERNLPVNQS